MSNDISFCMNKDCERKDCRRHWENTPGAGLYSMTQFEEGDGSKCEWYWKK